MFFKRKNKDNITDEFIIKTIITKTSSESQYEKEIERQIELKVSTCPECGNEDKYSQQTPPQNYQGTNTYVVSSKCFRCGTEWDTRYEKNY